MKNDQKYFVFAGDILDRTSETIGPLFIHVEATGEGCTLADAAQYLLQKLQDNNNTVVWLVPVDKEDEEKYLGIIDNAIQEKRSASGIELFNIDIQDCIFLNPSFFCGTTEMCKEDNLRFSCNAQTLAQLIWTSEVNSCHRFVSSHGEIVGVSQYCPGRNDVVELQFGLLPAEDELPSGQNKFFRIPVNVFSDTNEGEVVMKQLVDFIRNEYGDEIVGF